MKEKKLVYVSHWRIPSEKTMSPLIMRTCQEFASQGFDVELLIPKRENAQFEDVDPYEYHNVKRNFSIKRIWSLDFMESIGGDWTFLLLQITFSIAVFFRAFKNKEATYYFHDLRDAFFLSFLNRDYFLEMHDFYLSSLDFINKQVIKNAKGIISTNKIKIEKINAVYGFPKEKIIHAPNAVDIEMFDPNISKSEAREKLGLPQDEKMILYTGHLFYWKGVDTLLDAAKHLPEFRFFFVGGTDQDIEDFRKEAGGNKNVIVAGRKSHAEIPVWQRAADVLVLPNTAKHEESRVETSPVKMFEYMASGTPIVASDIPSIKNVLSEEMATFFEPDNPNDLAQKIKRILEDEVNASKKSKTAKQEAHRYSWKNRIESISLFMSRLF